MTDKNNSFVIEKYSMAGGYERFSTNDEILLYMPDKEELGCVQSNETDKEGSVYFWLYTK